MRNMHALAFGVVFSLAVGSTAFADVHVSIQNGHVSIQATDATAAQILAEWSKVGQTRIVNGDRVPGGLLTIELTDVPEQDALDVILRAASGYVAAPRPSPVAGASIYDRIMVLPTSQAPPAVASQTPAPFQRAQAPPFPQPDDDEEDAAPSPNVVMPANRGPVFSPFPQPQVVNPQRGVGPAPGPLELPAPGAEPGPTPTSPYGGVPVPGMVAPPPQQQQPGTQGPPQQPRRPGGPGGGQDPD